MRALPQYALLARSTQEPREVLVVAVGGALHRLSGVQRTFLEKTVVAYGGIHDDLCCSSR